MNINHSLIFHIHRILLNSPIELLLELSKKDKFCKEKDNLLCLFIWPPDGSSNQRRFSFEWEFGI